MRNKILVGLAVLVSLTLFSRMGFSTVTNQTVSTTTSVGNGVTVNYVIGFDFRDNTQVVVTLVDTSLNTSTVIAQGAGASKFTVTGGNPGTTVHMGTAPSIVQHLLITRSIPLTQPVVFDPASAFPYSDLGTQMDLLTLEMQNINANVAAGPSGGSSGGGSGLSTFPVAIADNFVGYNHAGLSTIAIPGSTVSLSANDILKFNGSAWTNYNLSGAGITTLINNAASPISPGAGGTGVSNSGNLTWGSHALAFTLSADTALTFPTSGTVIAGTTNSGNVANNIVIRDGSGNFSAGTVTANLTGNVTGNVTGSSGSATGNAANVTGTVAIGNGGTGQTTRQAAMNALAGTQSAGKFLRSDGTDTTPQVLQIGDVPQGFSRSKLAQSTANTLVVNDGSGNLSVLAGVNSGDVATYNGLTWTSAAGGGAGTLGILSYGADTGSANAYVIATPSPTVIGYTAGVGVSFVAANTNTGAATINVAGLGVQAIKEAGGGSLVGGDILVGQMINLQYDGTNFQMVSQQGPAVSANTASTIVKRDGSGNFSAGTITAALIGAVTGNVTGNLTGNASSATAATNSANGSTISVSTNASYYPLFVASSSNSNQPFNLNSGFSFNPSTKALTDMIEYIGGATTSTGSLNVRTVGDGVTQGFNLESNDGTHVLSWVQRNAGDFYLWNGAAVMLSATTNGAFFGTGNIGPSYKWDVNNSDSNTTVTSPSAALTMAIRNGDTTAGNFESIGFADSGTYMAAINGVNDLHTGGGTSHLSFVTKSAGTFAEKAQITNTGLGVGVGTPGQSLDISANARIRGLSTLGPVITDATGLLSSSSYQTALNNLAGAVTSGSYLRGNGTNIALSTIQTGDVAFSAISGTASLTSQVTGILPVTNGGTGASTLTAHDVLIGNGAGVVTAITPSTSGKVLTSNGTGSDPSFQTVSTGTSVPTVQKLIVTGTTTGYAFTVTSANATVGATYTNNGNTYTVQATISSGTLLFASQASAPQASGTLTKASGTGDNTITFSAALATATYTTPSGPAPAYLKVTMVGGGGGGAGSGTATNTGGTGGVSYFGANILTANPGVGGTSTGGAGGTASLGSAIGTAIIGGSGQGAINSGVGFSVSGGVGGCNPLAGTGGSAILASGLSGAANTGAGGGGGGATGATNFSGGGGGGAGGYVQAYISSPAGSYPYIVGTAGASGSSAGAGAGGGGAIGVVYVEEIY